MKTMSFTVMYTSVTMVVIITITIATISSIALTMVTFEFFLGKLFLFTIHTFGSYIKDPRSGWAKPKAAAGHSSPVTFGFWGDSWRTRHRAYSSRSSNSVDKEIQLQG